MIARREWIFAPCHCRDRCGSASLAPERHRLTPICLDKVPTSPLNPTMEKKLHKPTQPPESIPCTKRHDQTLALLVIGLMVAVQATAQPVTSVSAGYGHSLFLKSDGSLWAMGRNDWGQLGDGTQPPPYFVNRPEQILSTAVTAV